MVVADGKYTGEIAEYAYGPNKVTAIEALAATEGYDLASSYGYSDSITDEPLLAAVGHPHAVNPDKALRRVALERGWPILAFAEPGERAGFPAVRRPALAAGLVAAIAAGALLLASRTS
jgi:phosphoserine phosphatase